MLKRVNLLEEWEVTGQVKGSGYSLKEGLSLEYKTPADAVGWYPIGFERGNDSALDAMDWYGFKLVITAASEETEIRITAGFMDNLSVSASLWLAGTGTHEVTVKLSDFEIESCKNNIWRFLKRIEIQGNAGVSSAFLVRGDRLFVDSGVRGKSGNEGETVSYDVVVHNCTGFRQSVTAKQLFAGWESLLADISPVRFVLEPDGEQRVTAKVQLHRNMVAGGHENTVLQFTAGGDSSSNVQVEFKTLKRLAHPYIYYNSLQWQETAEKIAAYDQFKPGYDKIIADADAWVVTPPISDRDYCYNTSEEHYLMSAAYAYALSGEIRYADKIAAFLRYFIDEEKGYPHKKKGCSQSYVQEGHFFQHLAIPYDIIYNSGVLSPEEHRGVEKCFRIYMDILDVHLQQGHISNWLLSEITGAFYCALAIEDIERALRFVFGNGGTIEQFRCGLFNDGWWHECSVGYNIWVSSMCIHTAHSLLPFGYNILHTHFPVPFNDEVSSTYKGTAAEIKFGMANKKWGGNRKSYVCIKDMFDATIPFLDYRGVLFGISDSDEKKLEGVHFGSTFDLAYHYYKDPRYIPVIRQNVYSDPIFGHAELPDIENSLSKENAYADNVGIAMLRSQTAGREQREQLQAVIRYGSHGYAHGHYDRTGLLSVMRYGRSFFNPEHVWWGYGHFMYKFYVQNSLTKNMVVVDDKLQVPADSRRLLFYSGKAIQAAAVETSSEWAYPPYGGMVYNGNETLAERSAMNASSLPPAPDAPPYGELSGHTEPVRQRRVIGVTDDYIVLFDELEGTAEHQFDSLFQIKGFKELRAEGLEWKQHTSQFSDNPLSDAQFITDCQWYEVSGTSVASFETVFGEGEDMRGTRTAHNEAGLLKMDVHTAWPRQTEQMIGRAAEFHDGYTIPVEYKVQVDDQVKAEGKFGAWILGEGHCDIDITAAETLTLSLYNHPLYDEQKYPHRTKQGLFWGEAYLILGDGSLVQLAELDPEYINVDPGFGIGRDYEGGRVTIIGNEYPLAIPASPQDHEREASISVKLAGLDAVRFVGRIGADAFPGDESQRRRTYAVRTKGTTGRFVTVVEPYESKSVITAVTASSADRVTVTLTDGRQQVITLQQEYGDEISVRLVEYRSGNVLREETAGAK